MNLWFGGTGIGFSCLVCVCLTACDGVGCGWLWRMLNDAGCASCIAPCLPAAAGAVAASLFVVVLFLLLVIIIISLFDLFEILHSFFHPGGGFTIYSMFVKAFLLIHTSLL